MGKFKLTLCAALVAAATVIAPVSWAQEPADRAADPTELLDRISLDLRAKPLAEVAAYIARVTGATIKLGTTGDGSALAEVQGVLVTVQFKNVEYRQALRLVAESARCLVRREGGAFVIDRPPAVTLDFDGESLREVMQAVAKQSGLTIVIGSDVPEGLPVHARLRNLPWQYAVRALARVAGMTTVVEQASGVTIVRHPDSMVKMLETRVFKLKYVQAFELVVEGKPRWMLIPISRGPRLDIIAGIERGLPKGADGSTLGGVDWDEETRSLIVSERPDRLDEIQRLLIGLDRPTESQDRLARRLRVAERQLAEADAALKRARLLLADARRSAEEKR